MQDKVYGLKQHQNENNETWPDPTFKMKVLSHIYESEILYYKTLFKILNFKNMYQIHAVG